MRITLLIALALLICTAAWGAFDNPNYTYFKALDNPVNVKATEAQWSPDGTKVIWGEGIYNPTLGRDEHYAVKIGDWDAAARQIVNIQTIEGIDAADGWVGNAKWSPDGLSVAYIKWLTGWGPSQVWMYNLGSGSTTPVYSPVTGTDVSNFDFFGNSWTLVFWDWISNQADFFGVDLITSNRWRITNTPSLKEYEPRILGFDSNEILYWSGETAAEPYDSIHILNTITGTVSDVAFGSAGHNLYWPVWGRDNSYIGVVDWMSSANTDLYLYHKSGGAWTLAEDLTGPGYSGGYWTFFGDFNKYGGFLFQSGFDGTGRDIWYAERINTLVLTVPQQYRYVKPGATIQVTLDQSTISRESAGFQAFLEWDPDILQLTSAGYPTAPYEMPIIDPMNPLDLNYLDPATGKVNLAAGTITPAKSDAEIANLTFRALAEGQVQVSFRENNPPTMLTDSLGNEIDTTTMDSATIVVDGTAPGNVVIAAEPAGWTPADSVMLTFSANDPLSSGVASGIDHYELQVDGGGFFEATSPYVLDVSGLADGQHTITVKAIDQAGNEATAATTIYLDKTVPEITIDSAQQAGIELGTAIQGAVDIYVTATDATSELADRPTVTVTPNGGSDETATYVDMLDTDTYHYTWTVTAGTPNGIATINASVVDNAGNSKSAEPRAFAVNKATASIEVELVGVHTNTSRTISFVFGGVVGAVEPYRVNQTVSFTWDGNTEHNARGTAYFTNLPYNGSWTRISAKDEQHTLRKLVPISDLTSGNLQYSAALQLTGGDATNDNLIDILDFGVFAGQWGTTPDPGTLWPVRSANFDCAGTVGTDDFTFVQVGFLKTGDPEPLNALASPTAGSVSPRSSITVKELATMVGMKDAKKADVNKDGIVDAIDVALFLRNQPKH